MPIIFPEELPEVSSFEDLQNCESSAVWPCIEPENFKRQGYLSIGQSTTFSPMDNGFLKQDKYQANGWAIVHVRDALVHREFIINPEGNVLAAVPWWRISTAFDACEPYEKQKANEKLEHYLNARPKPEKRIIDQPCTIHHQAAHGHWMFEGLMYLAVWQKIGFLPSLLIDVPCPVYRKQFLDLLPYPAEKRIGIDRRAHDYSCKDLWLAVPWRTNDDHQRAHLKHGWTQDGRRCYLQINADWYNCSTLTMNMTRGLGAKASPQLGRGEKIFIRREGTALHRLCLNEGAAATIAEKHGFVSVSPSELTAEEEAAIFYQAKVVCGVTGGGVNNAVFCRPGTKVICISSEDDTVWPIQAICTVGELDLVMMRSTQFTSMDPYYRGSISLFALDLVAFEDLLASLEQSVLVTSAGFEPATP